MESKLAREILELQRQLSIQSLAHTQILSALLNIIDPHDLQRLKKILEVQSSSGELQGLVKDSCRLAVQLVTSATDEGVASDPHKLLRLIHGGKKTHKCFPLLLQSYV